jgi:membrane protein implicated in regulation of membrane protease activity
LTSKWRNISWWQLDRRAKRKIVLTIARSLLTVLATSLAAIWIFDLRVSQMAAALALLAVGAVVFFALFDELLFVFICPGDSPRLDSYEGVLPLVGEVAEARTNNMVFINGALWKAECEESLAVGEKVEVVEVRGLTLKVRKSKSP